MEELCANIPEEEVLADLPELRKFHLGVQPNMQIVAPETRHVLADNRSDQSSFRVSQHLFETRAFKVGSGIAVIHVELRPVKTVFCGVLFKDQLLRGDAVGLSVRAVISGQAAVEAVILVSGSVFLFK